MKHPKIYTIVEVKKNGEMEFIEEWMDKHYTLSRKRHFEFQNKSKKYRILTHYKRFRD